ncbi:STAS domain-containing protein [Actinomadura sp. ATCC 31491]|uniref:STAS domain-containing protein n=1 Tax=Actinomadura luzonensis TaxID=2805427 RepID=A0ABT0FUB4_9ACTN|nr:STAS domain-containing protein [Actinomadura luzonensis]MCK2215937.1 STAS domain-containing protein [Actinomadura luzonensis]
MHEASIDMDEAGVLRVTLRGEIDFTNSAEIHKLVTDAVAERRPRHVRVDLAEVTFIDSTGIGVLVDAMRVALAAQADFRVENPTRRMLDQLRTTGLLTAFGLE